MEKFFGDEAAFQELTKELLATLQQKEDELSNLTQAISKVERKLEGLQDRYDREKTERERLDKLITEKQENMANIFTRLDLDRSDFLYGFEEIHLFNTTQALRTPPKTEEDDSKITSPIPPSSLHFFPDSSSSSSSSSSNPPPRTPKDLRKHKRLSFYNTGSTKTTPNTEDRFARRRSVALDDLVHSKPRSGVPPPPPTSPPSPSISPASCTNINSTQSSFQTPTLTTTGPIASLLPLPRSPRNLPFRKRGKMPRRIGSLQTASSSGALPTFHQLRSKRDEEVQQPKSSGSVTRLGRMLMGQKSIPDASGLGKGGSSDSFSKTSAVGVVDQDFESLLDSDDDENPKPAVSFLDPSSVAPFRPSRSRSPSVPTSFSPREQIPEQEQEQEQEQEREQEQEHEQHEQHEQHENEEHGERGEDGESDFSSSDLSYDEEEGDEENEETEEEGGDEERNKSLPSGMKPKPKAITGITQFNSLSFSSGSASYSDLAPYPPFAPPTPPLSPSPDPFPPPPLSPKSSEGSSWTKKKNPISSLLYSPSSSNESFGGNHHQKRKEFPSPLFSRPLSPQDGPPSLSLDSPAFPSHIASLATLPSNSFPLTSTSSQKLLPSSSLDLNSSPAFSSDHSTSPRSPLSRPQNSSPVLLTSHSSTPTTIKSLKPIDIKGAKQLITGGAFGKKPLSARSHLLSSGTIPSGSPASRRSPKKGRKEGGSEPGLKTGLPFKKGPQPTYDSPIVGKNKKTFLIDTEHLSHSEDHASQAISPTEPKKFLSSPRQSHDSPSEDVHGPPAQFPPHSHAIASEPHFQSPPLQNQTQTSPLRDLSPSPSGEQPCSRPLSPQGKGKGERVGRKKSQRSRDRHKTLPLPGLFTKLAGPWSPHVPPPPPQPTQQQLQQYHHHHHHHYHQHQSSSTVNVEAQEKGEKNEKGARGTGVFDSPEMGNQARPRLIFEDSSSFCTSNSSISSISSRGSIMGSPSHGLDEGKKGKAQKRDGGEDTESPSSSTPSLPISPLSSTSSLPVSPPPSSNFLFSRSALSLPSSSSATPPFSSPPSSSLASNSPPAQDPLFTGGADVDDQLEPISLQDISEYETFAQKNAQEVIPSYFLEKKICLYLEQQNKVLYDRIETFQKERERGLLETEHLLKLTGELLFPSSGGPSSSDYGNRMAVSSSLDSGHSHRIQAQLENLLVAQAVREECRKILLYRFDQLNAHADFISGLENLQVVNSNGISLLPKRLPSSSHSSPLSSPLRPSSSYSTAHPSASEYLRDMLVLFANLFDSISLSWEITEYFRVDPPPPDPVFYLLKFLETFVTECSTLLKVIKACSMIVLEPIRLQLLHHVKNLFDIAFYEGGRRTVIKTEFPMGVRVTHFIPCGTTSQSQWFGGMEFECKFEFVLDPVLFTIIPAGIYAAVVPDSLKFLSSPLSTEDQQHLQKIFLKLFSLSLSQSEKKKLSRRIKKMQS